MPIKDDAARRKYFREYMRRKRAGEATATRRANKPADQDADISVEVGLSNDQLIDVVVEAIDDGTLDLALERWREAKSMPDRMHKAIRLSMQATGRGIGVFESMPKHFSAEKDAAGDALHFGSLKPFTPVEQVLSILQIAANRFAKENWSNKAKRDQVVKLFRDLAGAVQGMESAQPKKQEPKAEASAKTAATKASVPTGRMTEQERVERRQVRAEVVKLLALAQANMADNIREDIIEAFMTEFDLLKKICVDRGISQRIYRKILANLHPDRTGKRDAFEVFEKFGPPKGLKVTPAALATWWKNSKLVVADVVEVTMPRYMTAEDWDRQKEEVRAARSARARAAAAKRKANT